MSNLFDEIVDDVKTGAKYVEELNRPFIEAAQDAWKMSPAGIATSMVDLGAGLKDGRLEVHGGIHMPSLWEGLHDGGKEKIGKNLHSTK